MRLICPNCDAQYEVPEEVVPAEGRDVQCSNCGQTWFQHHADHVPEEESSADADEEVAPPAAAEPARRELDSNVADILREEARSEQEARLARQSDPLESQPDLGLETDDIDEDDRRALEARQRMARMRGEEAPVSAEAAASAAAMSSRRDLLPDIEEINSTLRNDEERAGNRDDPQLEGGTTRKRKRGFRRGLLLMLVLFVLLLALYIFAPAIAKAVPRLDPLLSGYVTWVDQLRMWLAGRVQAIAEWLDTVASQSGG